jgi:hypothetical protein
MKSRSEAERRGTEGNTTNVLTMNFRRKSDTSGIDTGDIPNDIAHPASKHYPEAELQAGDDPLSDLLHEFDDLVLKEDDSEDIVENRDEYIFHHQKSWDYQVKYNDDLCFMADTVLDQIKRLKEDSKRLKYYLDEMNLE